MITRRRREASHGVGHEQPRTDQSATDAEDQRRDDARPYGLLWAPREPVRGNAIERAREREVRTLRPATATLARGNSLRDTASRIRRVSPR